MRFLVFAVLLTVVYSFEEISIIISKIWNKLWGRNSYRHYFEGSDNFVTATLMYVAIPLTLLYYLAGGGDVTKKLILLAVQLLLIAILATGAKKFKDNQDLISNYHGVEKIGARLRPIGICFSPLSNV